MKLIIFSFTLDIIILPVFDDDTGEIKAHPPPNVKTLKLIKFVYID